ncbi:MAG: hypothetical protein ACBZ72_04540 [Candidatus Bathyarchaeia archaeon]|jgi:hypothetical protein
METVTIQTNKKMSYQEFCAANKLPTCPNRTRVFPEYGTVFCERTNDQLDISYCKKCSAARRERMSLDW